MEDNVLKSRIAELAKISYNQNRFTFTDFLSLGEQQIVYELKDELAGVFYEMYGGNDFCERKMVRFGSAEELGYEEEYPFKCLKIEPLSKKFTEDLTHRDYLGALMNLGIKREKTGDIIITDEAVYIYVADELSDYIEQNFTRVRHTSVKVSDAKNALVYYEPKLQPLEISAASDRIDAIVSELTGLSRSKTKDLFLERKVFVMGVLAENFSKHIKEGEVLSIRGYGKFIFECVSGVSKKGRLHMTVKKYI